MNTRPFTSATSRSSTDPAATTRAAASMSSGMPSSLAKWLNVPSGRMPSTRPVPVSAAAVSRAAQELHADLASPIDEVIGAAREQRSNQV